MSFKGFNTDSTSNRANGSSAKSTSYSTIPNYGHTSVASSLLNLPSTSSTYLGSSLGRNLYGGSSSYKSNYSLESTSYPSLAKPSPLPTELFDMWLAHFIRDFPSKKSDIEKLALSTEPSQFNECFTYLDFRNLFEVLLESATMSPNHAAATKSTIPSSTLGPSMIAESKSPVNKVIAEPMDETEPDNDDLLILSATLTLPFHPSEPLVINIPHPWNWNRFLLECCNRAGIETFHEMMLVKFEPDGWNSKLEVSEKHFVQDSLDHNDSSKNVFELRQVIGANVGGKFPLVTIAQADSYNNSLQEKIQQLSQVYAGYREIRGDGNCYYRAVVYGAMEMIISSPRRAQYLQRWITLFRSSVPKEWSKNAARCHELLLFALSEAEQGKKWPTLKHFEAAILDASTELDLGFIRAAKYAVTFYILNNLQTPFNGLSLETSIMAFDESCKSIDSHCEEAILKMGECAEGAHVYLGILPYLLGVSCEIVMLYADATIPLAVQHCDGLIPEKLIGEVSLLFRPGHYDLLYKEKSTVNSGSSTSSPLSRSSSTSLLKSVAEKLPSGVSTPTPSEVDNTKIESVVHPEKVMHCDCDKDNHKRLLRDQPQESNSVLPESKAEEQKSSISRGNQSLNDENSVESNAKVHKSSQAEPFLREHDLRAIDQIFYLPYFVSTYYLMVKDLELPPQLVLNAILIRKLNDLPMLIKLVWMWENDQFIEAELKESHRTWHDNISSVVKTCREMGIAAKDIVYAIAKDNAFEENDVIDSIEAKDKGALEEEVANEVSSEILNRRDSRLRRYNQPKYSDAELINKVKRMDRRRVMSLLKSFRYLNSHDECLSTRILREALLECMREYTRRGL